jgi:5-methylcytosine-specific restriction endonuclease McrA
MLPTSINGELMSDTHSHIIVESFVLANKSGHRGDVHMRPAKHQIHPQTLLVQCNKEMLDTSLYPVGTKFRYKVRLVTKASGNQFLGSHHAWPFVVVSDAEFAVLHPETVNVRKVVDRKDRSSARGTVAPKGVNAPSMTAVTTTQFVRIGAVKDWILLDAKGICECCQKAAPFNGIDGLPHLEVHHVRHLAQGGSDTIANTVALCPNCHRELHHGQRSRGLVDQLYNAVPRLIRE